MSTDYITSDGLERAVQNLKGLIGTTAGDLPWCSGYFQDRSIAKEEIALILPIVQRGDDSMVDGYRFTANESGLYLLTTGGARANPPVLGGTLFCLNTDQHTSPSTLADTTLPMTGRSFPALALLVYLDKGDYLTVYVFTATASASFQADGRIMRFTFAQLTREAT